jgi:hypothetical protein
MLNYQVTQVRNPHNHSQTGMTGRVIRTETVDAGQVSATREGFRESMRTNPAESSDSIQVHPA